LKDWLLLFIPAIALFIWYWGFWRNLDKDKSQTNLSKGNKGSNFIDNGFEVKSSDGKRYIQKSKPKQVKKAAVKRSSKKRATKKAQVGKAKAKRKK
jgi:hypothetical protein